MLVQDSGASRVHWVSSMRITSARLWLNRACSIPAVICPVVDGSLLPWVATAGDVAMPAFCEGTTRTPMLISGTVR
eukprot:2750211-Pleurochrysis_carterae.AAC.1